MNTNTNLNMVSELIRMTNSVNLSIDSNELIRISSTLQRMEINSENIHCILKLIANLTKFHFVIESNNVCFNFDINKLMAFALGCDEDKCISLRSKSDSFDSILSTSPTSVNHIFSKSSVPAISSVPAKYDDSEQSDSSELSDSSETSISDESSFYSKQKKNVSDGDIISLVNILCSKKYNAPHSAIELIKQYGVHKTSSYIPVFKSFIDTKDFDSLISFYNNYLTRNQMIIQQNRKIKEFNHKIRFYNEKIKLMKRKFLEFAAINDEIGKIDLVTNSHKYFNTLTSEIDDEYFCEITPRNERNLIELPNDLLRDIICIAIEHNNAEFIHNIIKTIETPSAEIISALNIYFTKFNYETIYSNIQDGKCTCCNIVVPNNVISDTDRINIMNKISNKILTTTHRHDNGQLISKSERQNIIDKWTEFDKILNGNNFDLIIDGANLGYINSKGNGEINIKFIQNTIRDIIAKTNKKVLLILHQRHTQKIKQLMLPSNISSNLRIYTTPNNVNDDWFWLYASIHSKSFILTNDQSRDHGCMVAYQNEIKKWTQVYQIPINMADGSVPTKVYASKNSVITPGIFIDKSILHIVTGSNNSIKNCICVHMA